MRPTGRRHAGLFDHGHDKTHLCLASTYLAKVQALRPQDLDPRLADSARASGVGVEADRALRPVAARVAGDAAARVEDLDRRRRGRAA